MEEGWCKNDTYSAGMEEGGGANDTSSVGMEEGGGGTNDTFSAGMGKGGGGGCSRYLIIKCDKYITLRKRKFTCQGK